MPARAPARRPGRPVVPTLTEPQRKALRAIEEFIRERNYPPTMRELADELGVSSPSAFGHLKQLERKGYIKREARKARSLVLVHSEDELLVGLVGVPLVGTVAAGRPILADENVLGQVLVENVVARTGSCFALRVQGDSMKKAGIREGDLVIVHQQPLAEHGDIVVAQINGETTVKRLYMRGQTIELHPENSKYRPIPIGTQADFRIIGKVVAVRRDNRPNKPK